VWEGDWEVLQGISTPQDKVVDETKLLSASGPRLTSPSPSPRALVVAPLLRNLALIPSCYVSGSVIGLLVCGWANRQD